MKRKYLMSYCHSTVVNDTPSFGFGNVDIVVEGELTMDTITEAESITKEKCKVDVLVAIAFTELGDA